MLHHPSHKRFLRIKLKQVNAERTHNEINNEWFLLTNKETPSILQSRTVSKDEETMAGVQSVPPKVPELRDERARTESSGI